MIHGPIHGLLDEEAKNKYQGGTYIKGIANTEAITT